MGELCSRSRMMKKDPRGYAILTNASLKLPTVMPGPNGYQGKMPPFKFKPPNADVPKTFYCGGPAEQNRRARQRQAHRLEQQRARAAKRPWRLIASEPEAL